MLNKALKFFFALAVSVAVLSPGAAYSAVYRLVAGTAHISDIATDLLPEQVEILTLIPASSCPGHHDMRASDMAFFSRADMVILHSWQEDYPGVAEAMAAAGLSPASMKLVAGRKSLLVPENQIAASKEMAAFLSGLPGVDVASVQERLAKRLERITALSEACLSGMKPYKGSPALSAAMQEEFSRWTGLEIVGGYGRAEDMSPGMLISLADTGKKSGVLLVVDNLQSGAEAGLPLARELGAAHVSLSNFPMFSPDVPTYEALLKHNVELIRQALAGRKTAESSPDRGRAR